MKAFYLAITFALAAGFLACSHPAATPAPTQPEVQAAVDKVVVGYVYTNGELIDPQTIPAHYLTHINYAFANIANGEVVEGAPTDAENYARLLGLRSINPKLKVLASVGGWTWSGNFSDMALTQESRARFIQSALAFVRRHHLDGIDLDWEFPGLIGYGNTHRPEDGKNFTALLAELRVALDREAKVQGRPLLSTIATGAFPEYMQNTTMREVHPSVDLINVMAYDLYESDYDKVAGHHAALFSHPRDHKKLSVESALHAYVVEQGVPTTKLVLGIPFYGRAWGEVQATEDPPYAPAQSAPEGLRTSYKNLVPNLIDRDGFERHWDNFSQVPYLWHRERKIFISYEDEVSIAAKAKFANKHGLRGMMYWSVGSDYEHRLARKVAAEVLNIHDTNKSASSEQDAIIH